MMKLGTRTGSLMNHVMSRSASPEPVAGMGATILGWTDRYPATIVDVTNDTITLREDNAVRTDKNGMSEAQEYEYTPDPTGCVYVFRKDRDGNWRECVKHPDSGRYNMVKKGGGKGLMLGHRDKYYDFSF